MVKVPGIDIPDGVLGVHEVRINKVSLPTEARMGPVVKIDIEILDGPAAGYVLEQKMFSFKSGAKSKLGQLFRVCLKDPGEFDTDDLEDKSCIMEIERAPSGYPAPRSGTFRAIETDEDLEDEDGPEEEPDGLPFD